ncbi:MAG: sugar phosphate isomerase/epimerase [Cyclobacteriaceae bacterium]
MKEHVNKKVTALSRRQFIGRTAAAMTGMAFAYNTTSFGAPAIIKNLGKPNSKFNGVQIGAITYSFRSLPGNAEQILKYCIDCNISAIELMGTTAEAFAGAPNMNTEPAMPGAQRQQLSQEEQTAKAKQIADWRSTVSMDKFIQLKKMYKDAGVSIYAWKPSALSEKNSDAEIDYALRVAKVLGASHVTVEIPNDAAHSKRLGMIADKHKIAVAYHGHLQQTITSWDEALSQAKYNGLNCDVGHYVAAGFDPIPLLESKHEHIYSMHLKDRKSKANGGDNMPWGQGDTPITEILQLMRKNKYKFPATVEMEYAVPQGSDAIKEVAKCVEFCRVALEKNS